jgi:hypothetical protein
MNQIKLVKDVKKADKEDLEFCVSHLQQIRDAARDFIALADRMPIALRVSLEAVLEAVPVVKELEYAATKAQESFVKEMESEEAP